MRKIKETHILNEKIESSDDILAAKSAVINVVGNVDEKNIIIEVNSGRVYIVEEV